MERKGSEKKKTSYQDEFKMNEGEFLDSMRVLVQKQVKQLTTIASIQDQVVDMCREHDERSAWAQTPWPKSLLSPYTYTLRTETFTILMLVVFLVLQLFIQLVFMGHLKHLAPHLPDFIQARIKFQ